MAPSRNAETADFIQTPIRGLGRPQLLARDSGFSTAVLSAILEQRLIQQEAYPATIATSARLKTYQEKSP